MLGVQGAADRDMTSDSGGESGRGVFPATRGSVIAALRSEDADARARSLEVVAQAYWKPVYKYVRLKWRRPDEDARDLTQAFFASAVEKGYFEAYDPGRARFRTYLRVCLDGFVAKDAQASRRLKRGGGQALMSLELDFDQADAELEVGVPASPEDFDAYFDREWMRCVLGHAVAALRTECARRGKPMYARVFERHELSDDEPSYADVARELGLTVSDVTNYLSVARREFRRLATERLRELSATDEEFRAEARAFFGTEP